MNDTPANDKEMIKQLKIELKLEQEHIEQLEKLLNHDPDTGLLQKHVLTQRLRKLIQQKKKSFAYGIIRLDRNYQRIRHTRDRMKVLLYITSERIKEIVGTDNLYQSDRSDEFLIILPGMDNLTEIESLMEEISFKIEGKHNPPASDITFGCHIGVALYPAHADSLEDLLVNAEIALGIYEQRHDNGFIYSPKVGELYHKREAMEMVLASCVRNNFLGFHMVFQPLMNSEKQLIGAEALLRWDAPEYGAVSPVEFIPMAERNGQIRFLGRWVLYHAMRQVKTWRETLGTDMYISINVSPIQLQDSNCVETIIDTLNAVDLPGSAVHLEITESSVMDEPEEIVKKLELLKQKDIKIMLDDFGTGYSSLSYLNQFPVDTLKIAKEFIDDFPNNTKSMETVRAILSLARNFGFYTLAEGVETQQQLDAIIQEGCHYIQGYYFSPPIAATEFEEKYLRT